MQTFSISLMIPAVMCGDVSATNMVLNNFLMFYILYNNSWRGIWIISKFSYVYIVNEVQ